MNSDQNVLSLDNLWAQTCHSRIGNPILVPISVILVLVSTSTRNDIGLTDSCSSAVNCWQIRIEWNLTPIETFLEELRAPNKFSSLLFEPFVAEDDCCVCSASRSSIILQQWEQLWRGAKYYDLSPSALAGVNHWPNLRCPIAGWLLYIRIEWRSFEC